jgi:hypothetical protein
MGVLLGKPSPPFHPMIHRERCRTSQSVLFIKWTRIGYGNRGLELVLKALEAGHG